MRCLALCLALVLPVPLAAQSLPETVEAVLDAHILPGFEELEAKTAELEAAAAADCAPGSESLRAAYAEAFDAWIRVSHLRFGPMETDNRGFALAFWPDGRGSTPRDLNGLIADADPVIETADDFATVSVAARGFFAMEFLLFDPEISAAADSAYGCALIRRVAADAHATAAVILADWRGSHADLMRTAGENSTYQSPEEALRAVYGALVEGLEATAELRLGLKKSQVVRIDRVSRPTKRRGA